jgi:hypothetical protein
MVYIWIYTSVLIQNLDEGFVYRKQRSSVDFFEAVETRLLQYVRVAFLSDLGGGRDLLRCG